MDPTLHFGVRTIQPLHLHVAMDLAGITRVAEVAACKRERERETATRPRAIRESARLVCLLSLLRGATRGSERSPVCVCLHGPRKCAR